MIPVVVNDNKKEEELVCLKEQARKLKTGSEVGVEKHCKLGNIYYSRANLFAGIIRNTYLKKATLSFQREISTSPSHCLSHKNLGNVYLDRNKPEKALRCLENSLAKKEEVFIGGGSLAWARAYLKTGRLEKAVEETTRILNIDEMHLEAYRLRAEAYEKQGELLKASVDRVTIFMQDGINRLSGIFTQAEAPIFLFEVSTDISPRVLELPDLDRQQSDFHWHVSEGSRIYRLARIGEGNDPIQRLTEARNHFLQAESVRNPTTQADLKDALYWLGLIAWRLGERRNAQNYFDQALSSNQEELRTKARYLREMSSHLNRTHYFHSGQFAIQIGEKEAAYVNFKHFLEISSDIFGAHEAEAAIFCAEFCLAQKNYPDFRLYVSHLSQCSSASLDVLLRTIGLLQEFRQHLQNYRELTPSQDNQETVDKLQSLENSLKIFLGKLLKKAKEIVVDPSDRLELVKLCFAESPIEVDNLLNVLERRTSITLCFLLRAKYNLLFSGENYVAAAKSLLEIVEQRKEEGWEGTKEEDLLFLKLKIEVLRREGDEAGLVTLSSHIVEENDGDLHLDYALAIKGFNVERALEHLESAKRLKPCFKVFKELVEALLDKQEIVKALSYQEEFMHYPPQDLSSLKEFAALLEKLGLLKESLQIYSNLEQLGISIPQQLQLKLQKRKEAQQITKIATRIGNVDQAIEQAKKAVLAYPHAPAYLFIGESYEKKLRFDGSSLEDLIPIWAAPGNTTYLPLEDLQTELENAQTAVNYERCARLLMEALCRSSSARRKELFRSYGCYLPSEVQEIGGKIGIQNGLPQNLAQEYGLMGACFAKKGRWKLASQSYRLAQDYSPQKDLFHSLIEEAKKKHQILENALENYQRAIDLGEKSVVHKKAALLMKVGRLNEARLLVQTTSEGAERFPEIGRAKAVASEERELFLRKVEIEFKRPFRFMIEYAQSCLDQVAHIDPAQDMGAIETNLQNWRTLVDNINHIQAYWTSILDTPYNDLEDFTYARFPEKKDLRDVIQLVHSKLGKLQDKRKEMLERKEPVEDIDSAIDELKNLFARWEERLYEDDAHKIAVFQQQLDFLNAYADIIKDTCRVEIRPSLERILRLADREEFARRLKETEVNSAQFPLLLGLAYACERAEQWEEAIIVYELALCFIPVDRYAIFRLVYLIQELNKTEEKIKQYSDLISKNPNLYQYLYPILGELYSLQNRPEAQDVFARAINIFPHELWLYERLIAIFQRENTPEEKILDLFKNLQVREVFLKCYFLFIGQHEKAQNYALRGNYEDSYLPYNFDQTWLKEWELLKQQGNREDASLMGSNFIRNRFYQLGGRFLLASSHYR